MWQTDSEDQNEMQLLCAQFQTTIKFICIWYETCSPVMTVRHP